MGLLSNRPGEEEDDQLPPGVQVTGLDDLEGEDELVYELDDWSEHDRAVLAERLQLLGLAHEWDGTSLVVAASDEEWVERILDQVEDELSYSLDPDVEQIAYDLSEWDETQREALLHALVDEAVPHGVEGGELFVHEIDEQRTDELIETFVNPDAVDDGGAGGQEVMGELFLAVDRLARDPRDHEGTLSLIDAARMASAAPPPYGMARAWWEGVVKDATSLVALVEQPAPDDEAVMSGAQSLKDQLRPYV